MGKKNLNMEADTREWKKYGVFENQVAGYMIERDHNIELLIMLDLTLHEFASKEISLI